VIGDAAAFDRLCGQFQPPASPPRAPVSEPLQIDWLFIQIRYGPKAPTGITDTPSLRMYPKPVSQPGNIALRTERAPAGSRLETFFFNLVLTFLICKLHLKASHSPCGDNHGLIVAIWKVCK
jgi:hypothetical protein